MTVTVITTIEEFMRAIKKAPKESILSYNDSKIRSRRIGKSTFTLNILKIIQDQNPQLKTAVEGIPREKIGHLSQQYNFGGRSPLPRLNQFQRWERERLVCTCGHPIRWHHISFCGRCNRCKGFEEKIL